jgi:hypothetical protein
MKNLDNSIWPQPVAKLNCGHKLYNAPQNWTVTSIKIKFKNEYIRQYQ